MKKRLFFLILTFLIFIFVQRLFSQEQVKIGINNERLKFKSFNYEQVKENAFKVSITDDNDDQITGLMKDDFIVTKRKKEAYQIEITPLSKIGDTKVRLALLIDNSFSMKPFIDDLLTILDNMFNSLGKGFYLSIIMFDEFTDNTSSNKEKLSVRRFPFTKDLKRIKDYYNYGLKTSPLSSGTYLYDAIKVTIGTFKEDTMKKVEKDIAVILSDGNDINSKTKLQEIESMNKENITFYTIDFMHSARETNRRNDLLEKIAKDSKGEYFSPKDISSLSANFTKIATKIVNLGYEVDYQFKYPQPTLSYKLDESEFSKRPETYRTFPGLLMEDIKIKESFPLLNYFFFDKNSDTISSRYILFTDSLKTASFSENKIEGGAIEHYYQILNIYGERLKAFPDSKITLMGTTDGLEPKWKELGLRRAAIIKKYLTGVWGIDSARITIQSKKLPDIPSSSKLEEGKEENRRVEILADKWDVSKPVTFIQNSLSITPRSVEIKIAGGDSVSIEEINLNISNNNNTWNKTSFHHQDEANFKYDWKNDQGQLPKGLSGLDFTINVVDNGGDKAESKSITIPIKEITSEISKSENLMEKKIEKVSLILFDFDSYNPGAKNEVIMNEYVYPKLTDTTLYIAVNGYTDKIGKPEYNLKLSSNRAEKVSSSLTPKYPADKVKFVGYGADTPLYTNELPEGRFYNRTVQLIFQNYKPE